MRINKIHDGGLRVIVKEVIYSAKSLGIKLENIHADIGEKANMGHVVIKPEGRKEIRMIYFKREGISHVCHIPKQDSLEYEIYKNIDRCTHLKSTHASI